MKKDGDPGIPDEKLSLGGKGKFEEEEEKIEGFPGGETTDATTGDADKEPGAPSHAHRHSHERRRVKIKKRIRVKKKTSSRRFYKKIVERIIWIAFIAGFITALVILFKQLNISDEKYKGSKKKVQLIIPLAPCHAGTDPMAVNQIESISQHYRYLYKFARF